jgi:hypothetical protein
MRHILAAVLVAAGAVGAYGFNNRLYLNGLWGVSYIAKDSGNAQAGDYHTFHGGNLGWHGLFVNDREDYWGSGFGSYNLGIFAEAGFYQFYGKNIDFPSLKFSAGISVGQYFVFYLKPNLFLHGFETLGISATGGLKIHLFMNDVALAYGIAIDFLPMFYIFGNEYPIPAAGVHLTVDIVYEINRTKRKNNAGRTETASARSVRSARKKPAGDCPDGNWFF